MVFNSAIFFYFFLLVLVVYWVLARARGGMRKQNLFLLVASYFFYGWWDWVFLGLIFISTFVDFFAARLIESEERPARRRLYLTVSMGLNLGLLGTFKYFDFFITGFVDMSRLVVPGAFPDGGGSLLLNVILPVGISFYTFQTMSYTIDVYRRVIPAERDFWDFALFVCFFPQLVAGPIERAGDLLPQLKKPRVWQEEYLREGAWLLLLGFFMKVYVADNLGPLVDQVYLSGRHAYLAAPGAAAGHGGFQVFMASIGFAFQIYGDFAGYSCIAMGTARLLGVRLTVNFDMPELAQNPAELWRRWHTTLNRWVMDYIYIPLGGSRYGLVRKNRNLILAFILMGLWHGANWTFLIWGALHGTWLVAHALLGPYLPRLPRSAPPWLRGLVIGGKMAAVYTAFALSAVFFRAYDISHSGMLLSSLFSAWDFSGSTQGIDPGRYAGEIIRIFLPLVLIDVMAFRSGGIFWIFARRTSLRAVLYVLLFFTIVTMGVWGRDVIYFAF